MPPYGRAGEDGATAQRLLDAAAHEFALHGYEAGRIRDIVDAAGANLAAVNYHFGGKGGSTRPRSRTSPGAPARSGRSTLPSCARCPPRTSCAPSCA